MGKGESASDRSHSVTQIIDRLKEADDEAAEQIWRRYSAQLLLLARSKLKALPDRTVDADDVLVSVFARFFRAVREGRFARLQDRDDLWQILLVLTNRNVADRYRRAATQKRGAGEAAARTDHREEISDATDPEPGPEFIAAFNDSLSRAIQRLKDDTTREVALLRMEGYPTREIADRLDISLSSVERKLRVVREVWAEEFSEGEFDG